MKIRPGSRIVLGRPWHAELAVSAALALAAGGPPPLSLGVKTATAVTKTLTGGAELVTQGAGTSAPGHGIAAGKPHLRCNGRRRRNAKGPKASARRDRNVPLHRRPRKQGPHHGITVDLDALS